MIYVKNRKNLRGLGEYIGRPSPLGNPFFIGRDGSRAKVIAKYRQWLWNQIQVRNAEVIAELGKLKKIARKGDLVLSCHCAPKPCHGDVVKSAIEWALNK